VAERWQSGGRVAAEWRQSGSEECLMSSESDLSDSMLRGAADKEAHLVAFVQDCCMHSYSTKTSEKL
jgi:hypothetical protein